jgi:hypothetical protein
MRTLTLAALALVGTTLFTVGTARADDCAPYGGSTVTTYDENPTAYGYGSPTTYGYGSPTVMPQPVYVPPPPVVAPVVYGRAPLYRRPVYRPARFEMPGRWHWRRR